MTCTQAGS